MNNIIILLILIFSTNLIAQETTRTGKLQGRKITTFERTVQINGAPKEVFAFMDDIRNTGKHMTENSNAMMGSKLKIEWLSENKTGLGTKYRWQGKVIGMKMDFTVEASKWIEGKEKVWGTVGDARMIVINWFEMYLVTTPSSNGNSNARLGIYYTKRKSILGFLLGKPYAKWCVNSMLKDTQKHFEKINPVQTSEKNN